MFAICLKRSKVLLNKIYIFWPSTIYELKRYTLVLCIFIMFFLNDWFWHKIFSRKLYKHEVTFYDLWTMRSRNIQHQLLLLASIYASRFQTRWLWKRLFTNMKVAFNAIEDYMYFILCKNCINISIYRKFKQNLSINVM